MPRPRNYSDEEASWIAEEAPLASTSVEMAGRFEERFGRRLPPVTLRTYCRKHGIHAGWQGTRDRSPVHETTSGGWSVNGVKMTAPQHAWWLAHGEMPPKGTNVVSVVPGDASGKSLRLVTDAELMALNQLRLRWSDERTFDLCLSIARIYMERWRAMRDVLRSKRPTMGLRKIQRRIA